MLEGIFKSAGVRSGIAIALLLLGLTAVMITMFVEDTVRDFLKETLTADPMTFVLVLIAVFISYAVFLGCTLLLIKWIVSISLMGKSVVELDEKVVLLSAGIANLAGHITGLEGKTKALGASVTALETIDGRMNSSVTHISRFVTMAPEVAGQARMNLWKTSLMMQPSEYARAIRELSATECPGSISIVGSMVGFTLTLADELAALITRCLGPLKEVHFIGPMVEAEVNGAKSNLVGPVWNFQLLVMHRVLKRLSPEALTGPWELKLMAHYVPFDPLSAAIMVPNKFVISLQAVSTRILRDIVKGEGHLVGMQYGKVGQDDVIYERFDRAIRSYREHPGVFADTIGFRAADDTLSISTSGLVFPAADKAGRRLSVEAAKGEPTSHSTIAVAKQDWQRRRPELLQVLEQTIARLEGDFTAVKTVNDIVKAAPALVGL